VDFESVFHRILSESNLIRIYLGFEPETF